MNINSKPNRPWSWQWLVEFVVAAILVNVVLGTSIQSLVLGTNQYLSSLSWNENAARLSVYIVVVCVLLSLAASFTIRRSFGLVRFLIDCAIVAIIFVFLSAHLTSSNVYNQSVSYAFALAFMLPGFILFLGYREVKKGNMASPFR